MVGTSGQALAGRDTRFRLSEELARELAAAYGTPLYVLDERHLRETIRRYKHAFSSSYPKAELNFGSKANNTLAVLAIAFQEGCKIDVASEGELRAALAAGVPASHCHFHGNNKQRDEIEFALTQGIGQIVVDNFEEIELVKAAATPHALSPRQTHRGEGAPEYSTPNIRRLPNIVLRLAPGVDPITHAKISTGQADTKFGFNIADGSAEKAALRCIEHGLPLTGFHCHVGSQLFDPEAQRSGGELIARFAADMNSRHGIACEYLNVGGGLGVRYLDSDCPMPVERYCRLVVDAVLEGLGDSALEPTLGQEPGRALVAECGVTLYHVGNIKTVPSKEFGSRTYVSVDGGLSDNPRPGLYGARYAVERAAKLANGDNRCPSSTSLIDTRQSPINTGSSIANPNISAITVTVSGKHCESDKLFEHISLPADLAPGDILQVLCTGAYNSSMASNYNRYPRPATALIREDSRHRLIQRRESWDEMLAREMLPEDMRQC